jgi:RND family efflux transporter MFP subunit
MPTAARSSLVVALFAACFAAMMPASAAQPASKPALTVSVVQPAQRLWAQSVSASGHVVAWQESSIAPEVGGLRIVALDANVGDRVKKGQRLAQLNAVTLEAELAQTRASVAEARAGLAQAKAEAERARQLQAAGMMSASQAAAQITAETTAAARLVSAEAALRISQVRLGQARIVAPDDGVISARNAAVGSLSNPGQELFRLIRQGRLEWRAELSADQLADIKPGMAATLQTPGGHRAAGTVRSVAPALDPRSLTGIVYVDLDPARLADARAGYFARGQIALGQRAALTLPQTAVLLREGFHYVFRVLPNGKVAQTKVTVGRREGGEVEITSGLAANAAVVESGVAFLADGDTVRVVARPAAAKP